MLEPGLQFKQKHEPVRVALKTVLAHQSCEMKIGWHKLLPKFFMGLAGRTNIRGLSNVHLQLAAAWTPEAAIWLLRTFKQKDFVSLVEAV